MTAGDRMHGTGQPCVAETREGVQCTVLVSAVAVARWCVTCSTNHTAAVGACRVGGALFDGCTA